VPFSTVFSIKFSFFLLLFTAVFLFSGCGSSSKPESVSDTDEDSTDADFDMDEEEDWEEDEEMEDEEKNDTEADSKPDKDTDSEKADTESDDDNDSGKPTRKECLDAGGTWNGEWDRPCYKDSDCEGKPENSRWVEDKPKYRQFYENGEWTEPLKPGYKTKEWCSFACLDDYLWNGSECLNPCVPNPCSNIEHSDETCLTLTFSIYSCGCVSGYSWKPDHCVKNPDKLSFGNICTEQRKCYKNTWTDSKDFLCPTSPDEEFFGQDAYYAFSGSCIRQNFSVKESGIENENIIVDNNLKLEWQQTIPEETYSWKDAVDYCKNLEYGGYTDWRLPTPQEFLSVVQHRDHLYDSYFNEEKSFWTSKSYLFDQGSSWYVDLSNYAFRDIYDYTTFLTGYSSAEKARQVRCVSGKTPENASFVNGDEIVKDNTTGLVWQKGEVSGKRWQEALEYCENLTYAGYSDWRLPNINELASLANYDKHSPASDFPDIPLEYFWSSTTSREEESVALLFFFYNASLKASSKARLSYVKCVR
jgi:hypothetical protein